MDEGAGTISFTAKLSLGVTLAAQEPVPSRDIVEFSGRLDTNALTGVLVSRLVNDGAMRTASTEKVVFDRDPDLAAAPSHAEWLAVWDARMKVRGPRW